MLVPKIRNRVYISILALLFFAFLIYNNKSWAGDRNGSFAVFGNYITQNELEILHLNKSKVYCSTLFPRNVKNYQLIFNLVELESLNHSLSALEVDAKYHRIEVSTLKSIKKEFIN